ncbi:unnamed protein product, partial [Staurois parvus]
MSARSCEQLCPITADHICHAISATYQCQSAPPISVSQCRLSLCISAHQSCLSVPPNSASQCRLSVPISAIYECCFTVPISDA